MGNKDYITEEDLKGSFKLFVAYVWKLLNLPPPTSVQNRLCDYLQEERHGDRIIQMYRGAGKSWITSAFVLWKLWNSPDLKFAIVSGTRGKADEFSHFCFVLMDVIPVLNNLKPRGDQRGSGVNWDVNGCSPSHSPSCKTFSITGTITGSRADYVIADDIETPENCNTAMQREKLRHKVAEFVHIQKADEGKGNKSMTIYLGTPHNEDSLYNNLAGFNKRIWPARYPSVKDMSKYKGNLCPYMEDELYTDNELAGQPTDPKRFNGPLLLDKELKVGRSGFALQYMLDTDLSDMDKYPLKLKDLITFQVGKDQAPVSLTWCNGKEQLLKDLESVGLQGDHYYEPMWYDKDQYAKYEGTVMAIDPSGKGKDETTYAIIKFLHGYVFLVAAGGLDGGYDNSVLQTLALKAQVFGVNEIVVEDNFGQGMFIELLKPVLYKIHKCHIEGVRSTTNKETRIINSLEPVMNQHRLVVSPDVIQEDYDQCVRAGGKGKEYSLFYQMTRLSKDKGALLHDDRIDALGMAIGYFTEKMSINPESAAEEKRMDHLEDIIKKQLQNDIHKKNKEQSPEQYMNFIYDDPIMGNMSGSHNSFIDNL